jgi:MFS family permease
MASEAPALTGVAGEGEEGGARWGALFLLALTILAGVAMQFSISPLTEAIKLELGLSDRQISYVQGLAVAIPVALLAIPVGRLTDRANRVRLLVIMALIWSVGTAMTAFANGFASLFAARMLANIGAILAIPVAISLASDLSRPGRRGRALLPLSIGKIVGQAAAFTLGGGLFGLLATNAALAGGLSAWRGVHLAFAILSVALLLPLLLLKEPPRRELSNGEGLPFGAAMTAIWSRRSLLIPLFVGQVTVVMADVAALNWAPAVLQRNYGQSPEDFAGWLGLVYLLSGLFGSLIGGFAADAGQKSVRSRGILLGAVAAALLAIPGAFFPLMPGVPGFALLLALLMLCGNVTGLVTATAIAVLVPNEIRGVCLGAFMVVGAVIGFGVAPTMTTLISDLLGGEAHLREALAIVMAVTSLIAAIGFARAMRGRGETAS